MIPGGGILIGEIPEIGGLEAEIERELKCMRRFAAIAARSARFHSGQLAISPFIAVNVFQITGEALIPVGPKEGGMKDLGFKTEEDLMQYATNVERSLTFLLSQPVISLFIVMNVLAEEAMYRVRVTKQVSTNTKYNLIC